MQERKEFLSGEDDKDTILDKLVESVVHNIMAAIAASGVDSSPAAMHLAVSAAGGAVQVISAIASSTKDLSEPGAHLNEGSIAFAAQLIAAAMSLTTSPSGEKSLCCSAGTDILAKALQNAEATLGRSLDADLTQGLVEAAKDEAAVAKATTRRIREEAGIQHGSSLH
jgi:hypothetical protein